MDFNLRLLLTKIAAILLLSPLFMIKTYGQGAVPDTTFKPYGKLSGYAFGDYYYKAHADSLHRGGSNQYTGIPQGRNAFQFRRIYLGYDYFISPKFAAQVLLAAEDVNDALQSNKYAFYIKYANIRWKDILPHTDLIIGQTATPAFSMSSEPVWGYRSIEKTIADRRKVPSYDMGVEVQGTFNNNGDMGYHFMIGNGTGAKPENDKYKHFYGDVYAKIFNQKLMIDLYGDYERLNWRAGFHHARSMEKLFIGYTTSAITLGAEGFITFSQNDVTALNNKSSAADTLSGQATGLSFFTHGPIIKNKLGFFARLDQFNPDVKYNGMKYSGYQSFSSNYEPNDKEEFITAGLDFTPVKNVHLMPNIWFNRYARQGPGNAMRDYDLVYRLTFYFIYK